MPSSTTVEHPQSFWDSLSLGIKVILPTDEKWDTLKAVYNKAAPEASAIIRPQNASHVQDIVRACVSHRTDFTVRSVGHDVIGRTQIENGVTIDLRSIAHVQISKDTKTAKIGGGILTRELIRALGKADLVTPTGPIASIGYVGWHTRGADGFQPSVFQPRETHYWLEIVGVSVDPEVAQEAAQWAANLKRELAESEPTNILDSQYLGFIDDDEVDLKHIYGDSYEELVALKRNLDPDNIFRNSVPRFSNTSRL
ncbi:6-hydroxy-D-nicotine oxidase [Fusarium albosuccineum]|uniref:6-hydroxy-D-nicotine oxidase n=1 Tax=Fusarium albosuccineum TaxID=1237068 RepID=A0A8H4LET6_9HYPO|nr:6-hydroxy-D-nicotine oxidase [Fusarium albosuccineum]